ncbi:hypothetical protein NDU88_003236 [Pleurodeles waltl]|uniref:Uncharacterized protein n=1 Tax=Pleurodeles waltl TaxID=8319 RepID=A0AAV7MDA7_PLEWA|nr:hypothetical protein NDU88_003236 [Pleurodeles waltl]
MAANREEHPIDPNAKSPRAKLSNIGNGDRARTAKETEEGNRNIGNMRKVPRDKLEQQRKSKAMRPIRAPTSTPPESSTAPTGGGIGRHTYRSQGGQENKKAATRPSVGTDQPWAEIWKQDCVGGGKVIEPRNPEHETKDPERGQGNKRAVI